MSSSSTAQDAAANIRAAMTTLRLGHGDLEVSKLGFGCMGVTAFYGAALSDEDAVALFAGVSDFGVTHFDTAEMYRSGNPRVPTAATVYNEVQLGNYLKTLPRSSFTVATKFHPGLHAEFDVATVSAALDASLQKLGLEYVDLYYLHRGPSTVGQFEEWVRSASALVQAGKIRCLGLSEVGPEWIRRAHAIHPITALQQEWSLLTRSPVEDVLVPVCKELGIGIVAYSPLARNLLTATVETVPTDWRASLPRYSAANLARNKELMAQLAALAAAKNSTPAQLSLAWLFHKAAELGIPMVPIPGTTKLAHEADNAQAIFVSLSKKDMALLEELAAQVAGDRAGEEYLQNSANGHIAAEAATSSNLASK